MAFSLSHPNIIARCQAYSKMQLTTLLVRTERAHGLANQLALSAFLSAQQVQRSHNSTCEMYWLILMCQHSANPKLSSKSKKVCLTPTATLVQRAVSSFKVGWTRSS